MFPTVTDICTPCGMAISTLSSNTCINATDANTLCMGTCRTLYDNVLSNCDNAVSSLASYSQCRTLKYLLIIISNNDF